MKKRKLKAFVIPTSLATLGVLSITTALVLTKPTKTLEQEEPIDYVSNSIISENIAVMNTKTKVIYPYTDSTVKIGKPYYNYEGTSEEQEKSIIYHENTYMQNSGIDFTSENPFEVVSVLDGTVSNVKEDEILGKVIEINHGNEFVSVYQSLSETNVKKGDNVFQGQVIGISGTSELNKEIGNNLHFEFYVGGQVVNPILYLDKELPQKKKEE